MHCSSASIRSIAKPSSSSKLVKVFAAAWMLTVPAVMQSQALQSLRAHYSGAQINVGSGQAAPFGIVVDGTGNLYIAGYGGIIKETRSGGRFTQSVLPITTLNGAEGVAVDGSGNVYIADSGNNRVVKETLTGGIYTESVIPTAGSLSVPRGVAVDFSGNIYIADSFNSRVLKETPAAGSYTQTTVGSGLNNPSSVAVDASGNVYIADTSNNRALKETLAGGVYTQSTLGSGLANDRGINVDGNGNVYIADSGNNRVVKETPSGGSYTQSVVPSLALSFPSGVAVDGSGDVFIANLQQNQVVEVITGPVDFGLVNVNGASGIIPLIFTFDTAGTLGSFGTSGPNFGSSGTTPGTCAPNQAETAGASCTVNVVSVPTVPGTLYSGTVLKNTEGAVLATGYVFATGSGPQVNFLPGKESAVQTGTLLTQAKPQGVAVDASGNVYVADYTNNQVVKYTPVVGGTPYASSTIASSSNGGLHSPEGVAVDGAYNVYIADSANNRVLKETPVGSSYTQSTVASDLSSPGGVAVDNNGNVYIADTEGGQVLKETFSGGTYTQSTVTTAGLVQPFGVAVDGSGNVYIADYNGQQVLKETLSGSSYTQTTLASSSTGLGKSTYVVVDGAGNVYIADYSNNRILKETLSGVSYTESTVPTGSTLSSPFAAAADGHGNVYISDVGSQRVLKEDFADPPTLVFAATVVGSTSTDSPKTVTVSNIGNAALGFPVPGSGSNPIVPSAYQLASSTTCPEVASSGTAGSLAADSSCVYAINFIPTGLNGSGAIVLTDNNLNTRGNAAQFITLRGTGLTADATHTTLTAVPSPDTVGQPVTLTAVVSDTATPATVPAGRVSFTDTVGTTLVSLNNGTAVSLVAGTATLQFTPAVPGTHTITANFAGTTTAPNVSPAPRIGLRIFASSSGTATLTVTAIVTTLSFAPVPAQTFGNPPFAVSATSASTGVVTYSVVSGPATIAGNIVTLTGAGAVMLTASQGASGNYAAATANVSFPVAAVVPTLSFAPIAAQKYGNPPFAVSATSASSAAVTYAVVSGPATIASNIVTLTGAGTVILTASQGASGNYAAAAANVSFPVAAAPAAPVGFTLTTSAGSGVETVLPGGAAAFNLMLAPDSSTYPNALTLSATGLPAGATATFSPATIPAGGGATRVTMTIQTVNPQTARDAKPGGSLGAVALAFLLLPMAGITRVRRQLKKLPGLPVVLAAGALSLAAIVCLSGCGSGGFFNQAAKSYTVVVTATDAVTGAHSSTDVTLTVQ